LGRGAEKRGSLVCKGHCLLQSSPFRGPHNKFLLTREEVAFRDDHNAIPLTTAKNFSCSNCGSSRFQLPYLLRTAPTWQQRRVRRARGHVLEHVWQRMASLRGSTPGFQRRFDKVVSCFDFGVFLTLTCHKIGDETKGRREKEKFFKFEFGAIQFQTS
jgi:hypothetical protein